MLFQHLNRMTGRKEEQRIFDREVREDNSERWHWSPHEDLAGIFGRKVILPLREPLPETKNIFLWTWPGIFRNPAQFAESINIITRNTVPSPKRPLDLALSFKALNSMASALGSSQAKLTCPILSALFMLLVNRWGLLGLQGTRKFTLNLLKQIKFTGYKLKGAYTPSGIVRHRTPNDCLHSSYLLPWWWHLLHPDPPLPPPPGRQGGWRFWKTPIPLQIPTLLQKSHFLLRHYMSLLAQRVHNSTCCLSRPDSLAASQVPRVEVKRESVGRWVLMTYREIRACPLRERWKQTKAPGCITEISVACAVLGQLCLSFSNSMMSCLRRSTCSSSYSLRSALRADRQHLHQVSSTDIC